MRKQRILSAILSVLMILSVFTFTASAKTGTISAKTSFNVGEAITFSYEGSTVAKDWIAIYNAADTGIRNHIDWLYTPNESGTVTFPSGKNGDSSWASTPGDYVAIYLWNDGYHTEMDRLSFSILEVEPTGPSEYYVKKGGSGDGRSAGSPAGTIVDVVKNINADGWGKDDLVTVYIIDSGEAALDAITSDCVIGYNNSGAGQVPNHAATIKYTNYDKNTRARIGHVKWAGASSNAAHFDLCGPSIFENVDIIDMRNTGSVTEIYFNSYSAEFENCKFYVLEKSTGKIKSSVGHFQFGQNGKNKTVTGNQTVSFDTAEDMRSYTNITGYSGNGSATQKLDGDFTLYLNGGSAKWIYLAGSNSKEVITGNLNIVFNNDAAVQSLTGPYDGSYKAPVVNGSVQLVQNFGTTIPANHTAYAWSDTNMTTKSPLYHLVAKTNEVAIDVTDTAGKFAVATDKLAYVISADKTRAYYGNEFLNIGVAGNYEVNVAESIDDIIALLPAAPEKEGWDFVEWEAKDGVISAVYSIKTDENENSSVIWVDSANGADSNNGLTRATAVSSLTKAFSILEAGEKETKTVVIIGDYSINGNLPAHSSMITITGDGTGKSNIVRGNNSFGIGGPTTFENINFHITVASKFIETAGQKLVIGENVTYTLASGVSSKLSGHIGTFNSNGGAEELEISSDFYAHIGAFYNSETRTTAGAKVTVTDGNATLNFGSDGWQPNGTQFGVVFTDTVSIIQNGGSVTPTLNSKYTLGFECDVQFVANNGTELPNLPNFPIDENHGLFILKAEKEDGCYLYATDVAGKFAVIGGKTALAVTADGKQFVSADGFLTVPAGTYTVTFEDEVYYTAEGDKIRFYKNFKLDLSTIPHNDYDGKLFIGWAYEDGSVPESDLFNEGDILYAQYIDYVDYDAKTETGDFYIEGAQIRLASAAKELGEALRFVVRRTDATDALDIVEYGSVVAPSLAVGKSNLEIGKQYTYNSKQYEAKTVPAEILFGEGDGYEQYTVCITDIDEDNYAGMFTVKGYIIYKDLNGYEKIIYTDYYATNLVNVAKAASLDPAVSEAEKAHCEALIETEKERVRQKYNYLEKKQLMNNFSTGSAPIPLDLKYQLGAGGVSVREVVIETGDENAEPLEIFQITDLHFNYCNDEDFEEANPSIMATYNGRKWLANGSSVPNAVRALEYASQGDAIVITGDVLDYMSRGAMELAQKYIWDPYPEAMVTLGNHEMTRRCQDNPVTPDPTTLESRYDILQENWAHDVYYESRVLDDRLMLIQMDNGSMRFWDNQVEPFKADIELAREKGYTILLFYHVPICTNNPNETDVYPIRRNDTFNWNFSTNAEIGYAGTTGATAEICDLIANNADVIKGIFAGHYHSDYKTEIYAKTPDGEHAIIPQYVLTGNPYDGGHAMKITVK